MRSSLWGRIAASSKNFVRNESGSAVALIATSMIVMVGAAGLAFDSGRGYLIKARLGQALDAAALAGGRSLTIGGGGDYEAQVNKYFDTNFPQGYMGANVSEPQITLNAAGDEITVAANATIPTTLMRVLTRDDMVVSASASVKRALQGLEVAMVLDNSGSMRGRKLGNLKTAANTLVDILYGDNETVEDLSIALVPFSSRSNLDSYPDIHNGAGTQTDPRRLCFNFRGGSDNTSDATPSDSAFDHYTPPGRVRYSDVCPEAPVLALEGRKSTVKTAIRNMDAGGSTRYDVGTVWGWRAVSPRWDGVWGTAGSPLPYDAPNMQKAVIVMTDGQNTPWQIGDPHSGSESEGMFSQVCSSMKAAGVVVYTITFQLNDADTNTLFRNCASGEARYFRSPNNEQLQAAFTEIANDLTTLRLTR